MPSRRPPISALLPWSSSPSRESRNDSGPCVGCFRPAPVLWTTASRIQMCDSVTRCLIVVVQPSVARRRFTPSVDDVTARWAFACQNAVIAGPTRLYEKKKHFFETNIQCVNYTTKPSYQYRFFSHPEGTQPTSTQDYFRDDWNRLNRQSYFNFSRRQLTSVQSATNGLKSRNVWWRHVRRISPSSDELISPPTAMRSLSSPIGRRRSSDVKLWALSLMPEERLCGAANDMRI